MPEAATDRPLILLTNDDGHNAPGLRTLASALAPVGRVLVVAPQRQQSAVSHTITLHKPLRLWESEPNWYVCSGTPVDCVYLAINYLCQAEKPQLVVSGINHGANLGNDVFYSGTVAGAMEGLLLGSRAMAVSLVMSTEEEYRGPGRHRQVDYRWAGRLAAHLAREMLAHKLPAEVVLNLNVPSSWRPAKGLRVVRLGRRFYGDVVTRSVDPRGRAYYWIGGADPEHDNRPDTDCTVVSDGFATLTPVRFDLTAEEVLGELRDWQLENLAGAGDFEEDVPAAETGAADKPGGST